MLGSIEFPSLTLPPTRLGYVFGFRTNHDFTAATPVPRFVIDDWQLQRWEWAGGGENGVCNYDGEKFGREEDDAARPTFFFHSSTKLFRNKGASSTVVVFYGKWKAPFKGGRTNERTIIARRFFFRDNAMIVTKEKKFPRFFFPPPPRFLSLSFFRFFFSFFFLRKDDRGNFIRYSRKRRCDCLFPCVKIGGFDRSFQFLFFFLFFSDRASIHGECTQINFRNFPLEKLTGYKSSITFPFYPVTNLNVKKWNAMFSLQCANHEKRTGE